MTLLGSLPQSYSSLVTALEARENVSLSYVSLSYVQQSLVHEESKLNGEFKQRGSNQDTSALLGGHKRKFQRGRITCYGCGEEGHIRRDCPNRPRHKAKSAGTSQSESDTEETGAFTTSQSTSQTSVTSKRWLIDSGATSHMTNAKELLTDYEEFSKPESVSLGDGRTLWKLSVLEKLTCPCNLK